MTIPDLVTVPMPKATLLRVARKGLPIRFDPPPPMDWRSPKLGGRFDSPDGDYATLYFASEISGALSETIAPYARASLAAELGIYQEDPPSLEEFCASKITVTAEFKPLRANATAEFVDIEQGASIRHLEIALEQELIALGLTHLGAGQLKGDDRRLTRLVSGYLHKRPDTLGIRYLSQLGAEHECWAIFDDRVALDYLQTEEMPPDHPDIVDAWKLYGLD